MGWPDPDRHDPAGLAASYLGGELGRRRRGRFERHLLDCAGCRAEVAAGRVGRMAAESLRELAPPGLRDRVRATVELSPVVGTARRPRALAVVGAAAAVAVLLAAGAAALGLDGDAPPRAPVASAPPAPGSGDPGAPSRSGAGGPTPPATAAPASLLAIAAAYRGERAGWSASAAQPPVVAVRGMRWTGSRQGMAADLPVVLHRYAAGPGREVLVVGSARGFPHPADARPLPGADWIAPVDGLTVVCVPVLGRVLVVGADPVTVTAAADALAHS
jgi:hypothetical protein